MRTLQALLPNPRHVEVDRIFVAAPPEAAWPVVRNFDPEAVPWVHLLFALRTLPERLMHPERAQAAPRVGLDQLGKAEGFMILRETPGKELVVGSVGQFWHLSIVFAKVAPADFPAFDTPGWGKLAWALTVEPFMGGSTIGMELRTTATDEASWKLFERYYALIGGPSRLMRKGLLAHLEAALGKLARPDDDARPLPGDERLPAAHHVLNHGTLIEAPPSLVWRYLMQLGCDRAGWYSVDALDHGGVPSVDHLVAGWETRAVGDVLQAVPGQRGGFEVYEVAPERHLVIGGGAAFPNGEPYRMSWAFVLEPVGADATKLLTRVRADAAPSWVAWTMGALVYPPIHAVMQLAQLHHIRRLAERDALGRGAPVPAAPARS